MNKGAAAYILVFMWCRVSYALFTSSPFQSRSLLRIFARSLTSRKVDPLLIAVPTAVCFTIRYVGDSWRPLG